MDDDTPAGDHGSASTRSCRPRQKTTSNGNGPTRSHPKNLPTSSPRCKSGEETHGAFQNHERDTWTSSRCDQSWGDATAWNTVDDQTVETSRTLHVVRAMRGILRHPVSGISDVDSHGTISVHLACIATTGATRDEEQEEQCCEARFYLGQVLLRPGSIYANFHLGQVRLRPIFFFWCGGAEGWGLRGVRAPRVDVRCVSFVGV